MACDYDQLLRRTNRVLNTSLLVDHCHSCGAASWLNKVWTLATGRLLFLLCISGTTDGAGGVGGLLWVTHHTGQSAGTHFAAYDGNGNIVALSAASDGSESARYEYGPFGEPIRVTGPAAALNPFRFSTKRTDPTADLLLYEYRVYQPSTGRWPNRDPIGEESFYLTFIPAFEDEAAVDNNEYVFVRNSPSSQIDYGGLLVFENESCQGCNAGGIFTSWGYSHVPAEIPCSWKSGGSGSFSHACFTRPGYPALCNTETHIRIRAKNDDPCCRRWAIVCDWSYAGEVKGTRYAQINLHMSFLGGPLSGYPIVRSDPAKGASVPGSYAVSVTKVDGAAAIAIIPPGTTRDIIYMQPRNHLAGRPNSIVEVGRINCTASCLE